MLFKGRNALAVMFERLDEMLQQFVVTFKLRKLFIYIRQHDTRTTEFADGASGTPIPGFSMDGKLIWIEDIVIYTMKKIEHM